MGNDLISVIVPIYNVEKYINKCVDSLINQTYTNLEIILVDDGSPDNCGNICDSYEKKDSRIKVLHKKNGGLSDARNKGFETSTGEYVIFVDSDDFVEKNFIEKLYKQLLKDNSDICMCDFVKVFEEKIEINNYEKNNFCVEGIKKFDFLFNEYRLVTTVQWNKLFKRKIFEQISYPFGKVNEDEYVIADELFLANKISYVLNEPLYNYVQRNDSIMGKFKINRFDLIEGLEKRNKFFHKNNLRQFIKLNNILIFNNLLYLIALSEINKISDDDIVIVNNYKAKIKDYAKIIIKYNSSLKIKFKTILAILNVNFLIKMVKEKM